MKIEINRTDRISIRLGRIGDGLYRGAYGIEHGYPSGGAYRMETDPEGYKAIMEELADTVLAEWKGRFMECMDVQVDKEKGLVSMNCPFEITAPIVGVAHED